VPTLLEWVDTVKDLDVHFAGFSNPKMWDVERLLKDAPDALARAKALPKEQQWRLVEALDPDTFTHYEFFLVKGKKGTAEKKDWQAASDEELLAAKAVRCAGLQPWPAQRTFDQVPCPRPLRARTAPLPAATCAVPLRGVEAGR